MRAYWCQVMDGELLCWGGGCVMKGVGRICFRGLWQGVFWSGFWWRLDIAGWLCGSAGLERASRE